MFLSAVDGLTVLEGKGHLAIGVDRGVIQQACPEAVTEHRDFIFLLLQEPQKVYHFALAGFHVADPVADLAVFLLDGVKALAQIVEAFLVFSLILCDRGVLPDAFFHHPGEQFHLAVEPFLLCQQVSQVEDCLDRSLASADGLRPRGQKDIGGGEEPGFDGHLVEVRRSAALFVFVLLVALPDRPLVDIVGVPDLGAVPATAVTALDLPGEEVDTAVPVPALGASGHFTLHHLEGLRINDGLVIALDVILRDLALVGLRFFGQEIHGVTLLQQGIALVLLVHQDALNRGLVPFLLTAG